MLRTARLEAQVSELYRFHGVTLDEVFQSAEALILEPAAGRAFTDFPGRLISLGSNLYTQQEVLVGPQNAQRTYL